mgnify:CR=1 FL=1
MNDLYALILAGGSGTRLWPWSREELPKQFLSLAGKESLFQQIIHLGQNGRTHMEGARRGGQLIQKGDGNGG